MQPEMELYSQYNKYWNRLLTSYESLALEDFKELKQTTSESWFIWVSFSFFFFDYSTSSINSFNSNNL